MPPPFYEHHEPLMVPYNFDLSGFGGPSGFPGDFHPSLPLNEHTAALHANGALGAETNNVVTNITGGAASVANTPGLSAYATVGKLKDLFPFAISLTRVYFRRCHFFPTPPSLHYSSNSLKSLNLYKANKTFSV